ncbi:hypothetical protein DSM104443_01540 [Usitatibacter rugosus]|uniref:Fibronectin type-III domain-containing protein n=1 Tax=Usitatibacter rugosus TaxID=2732067 RepID=A0A6M4GTN5_9PROT|nr:fibronectin type III domain-containing protein [Usitatibacter rugosus]QJR10476.1 hypothetical protein DSM104443_01540 [Usitatibacter rugosus]
MTKLLAKPVSFIATAVVFSAIALFSSGNARAAGEPVVSPLNDGGSVYHYHPDSNEKYQLFSPPTGIKHPGGVMHWRYNDANRPVSVTKNDAITKTQAAMAKWTAVCKISFVYDGETAVGFNTSDGNNVVGWDTTIVAPTTGITYVAWNPGTGLMTDSEIRLNANYTPGFDSTLVHEVGHALGLQHSDVNGAVMSGPPLTSYNGMSSLGADDVAGCVFLYGAPGGPAPGPDTTAPTVPTGLAATATGQTTMSLTWNASSDAVGVANYKIFRASNGSQLGTVTSPGANVTNLTPGTTYGFTVSACDAAGNCSAQTAVASATTQGAVADTQAPSVPTGLNAAGAGTTQISLSWGASSDNVGVTSYKVFRGGTQIGTPASTSMTATGLQPGTGYSFTVSACDAAGNCSAQSTQASASTFTASSDTQAPTIPTGLFAMAVSSSSINLSWSASSDNVGVTSYRVLRNGSLIGSSSATNTTASGLLPSSLYSFTVQACDAAGNCSGQSTASSATTLAATGGTGDTEPPTVPTNLVATAVNSSTVVLTWLGSVDNGPGNVTYRLYRDGAFVSQGITANASVTGLAGSTTYTFNVQACDVSGNCSPMSPSATARTTGTTTGGPGANYQDLWWSPGQNGWGLTITQHGEALFIAMFVYDATGKPLWVVLTSGTWDSAHTTYTGALYIPAGSWFGAYDKARFVVGAPAGTAAFRFNSLNSATITYTLNGVSGTKAIERLPFGVVDATPVTDYSDAWWAGTQEDGWGLVLSQQYRNIFAAWYTYDNAGQNTWFIMSDGVWTSPTTYTGKLYRTRGSQVFGANYNQAAFGLTEVGNLVLTFSGTGAGTMTYTVDGLTQTKAISRLGF